MKSLGVNNGYVASQCTSVSSSAWVGVVGNESRAVHVE